MFGWLREPASLDSRRKRWAKEGSDWRKALSSLRATERSRSVWWARKTVAIPPRPSSSRISWRPTVLATLRVPDTALASLRRRVPGGVGLEQARHQAALAGCEPGAHV